MSIYIFMRCNSLFIYSQYNFPLSNEIEVKNRELNRQTERKVYEKYGLTDQEIALVEGSIETIVEIRNGVK